MLLKDKEKPPKKPRKGLTDGSDVAGASPEIMVKSEVVNDLHILKHIKERIRNIFVFLSLLTLFLTFPVPFTAINYTHSNIFFTRR